MKSARIASAVLSLASLRVDGRAQSNVNPGPNARRLIVVDRQGQTLIAVAERGAYSQPAFSADRMRLAVVKADPHTNNQDIWTVDLSNGALTRITSDPALKSSPMWSPDDSHIGFVTLRGGAWGLARKASSGIGDEEQLYRHTGFGGISNPEWSPDGRSLIFSDPINISGALYVLPLNGDAKASELMRPPVFGARMSPDRRFVAFQSAQSGRTEIYVRSLDASSATGTSQQPWQISKSGGLSTISWRQDGKELFYLAPDRGVMAVDVTTTPSFQAGIPRRLFQSPDTILALGRTGVASLIGASHDGQRFVFAVPPSPPSRQLTLFDRQGTVLRRNGGPATYGQPALSPDGTRAAVVHTDVETGNQDIWTVDLSTGKSAALTADAAPDSAPVWSPDGRQVAYVSTRGDYTSVYRKTWNRPDSEQLVYRNAPGAGGLVLTDWSADGRFLSFYAADVLCVLPLQGAHELIEVVRTEFSTIGGRFSPDAHMLAYLSDESGRYEVYVRTFEASLGTDTARPARVWQVSREGAQGMIFWRQDGKNLGYLAADGSIMSVDITASLDLTSPTPLFRPPSLGGGGPYGAIGNPAQLNSVSRDGQLFLIALLVPANPSAR